MRKAHTQTEQSYQSESSSRSNKSRFRGTSLKNKLKKQAQQKQSLQQARLMIHSYNNLLQIKQTSQYKNEPYFSRYFQKQDSLPLRRSRFQLEKQQSRKLKQEQNRKLKQEKSNKAQQFYHSHRKAYNPYQPFFETSINKQVSIKQAYGSKQQREQISNPFINPQKDQVVYQRTASELINRHTNSQMLIKTKPSILPQKDQSSPQIDFLKWENNLLKKKVAQLQKRLKIQAEKHSQKDKTIQELIQISKNNVSIFDTRVLNLEKQNQITRQQLNEQTNRRIQGQNKIKIFEQQFKQKQHQLNRIINDMIFEFDQKNKLLTEREILQKKLNTRIRVLQQKCNQQYVRISQLNQYIVQLQAKKSAKNQLSLQKIKPNNVTINQANNQQKPQKKKFIQTHLKIN